jgi:hypothetical protein
MAEWIRANLPPGVAIANAATSVEYLSGHRNVNLHGVTSPAFVGGRTAEREASLFESLGRLKAEERPGFLLLTRSGREGSELLRALAASPPLHETASLSDDLQLFPAQWDLLDRGDEPFSSEALAAVAGLQETDRLDVCDARDEAAHGYRYESRRGEMLLAGAVGIGPAPGGDATLADAGRLILGSESFRVRSRAGRDLVVVLRSRSPVGVKAMRAQGGLAVPVELPEAGMVVRAGGREVLRLALPNRPGWNEYAFRVPAEAVAEGTTELEISGRYAAFHYWFYQ